jgi:phosphatidylglycerol:prolipoprotein diacylglycerol transferase
MDNFLQFYQHIPERIDPVIFSFGFFSLGWYSLMYFVGFFVVYGLLIYRIKEKEAGGNFNNSKLIDFLIYAFLGLIIGGRFGYVVFYDFSFYFSHPLAVISPFDFLTGEFIGIYGMSYHGGLIGVLFATWIFIKKYKLNFWKLSDLVVPAIPLGYFFGRVGNFLNGELYGRATNIWLGMYFPSDTLGILRHPSQLYEAFLEGIVLFLVFWKIRNQKIFQGKFLALYFMGYAAARFLGEFFREPDEQVGFLFGSLTLGQLFSLGMIIIGLFLLFIKKTNCAIIKKC